MKVMDWYNNKRDDWANKKNADDYEGQIGWYARQVDREILNQYLGGEKGRILDLPCGTGRFLKFLENDPKRFSPIGADYSVPMLSTAAKSTHSPLVRADAFNLPMRPNCFDIVLCSRLVFHYKDPLALFQECYRVLKEDGVFIFDTLNKYTIRHLLARPFNLVRAKKGKQLWFSSEAEVRDILASSGYVVEKQSSRYILPTRAYRYLPGILIGLVSIVERLIPSKRRVLTFWKVRKISTKAE